MIADTTSAKIRTTDHIAERIRKSSKRGRMTWALLYQLSRVFRCAARTRSSMSSCNHQESPPRAGGSSHVMLPHKAVYSGSQACAALRIRVEGMFLQRRRGTRTARTR